MCNQEEMRINGSGGGYHVAIVDYLKAICIVLVIFNHTEVFDPSKPLYYMIVNMAVPVFMILSGYVMGLDSADKSMVQLYERNRLLRKLLRYIMPMLMTFFIHETLWVIGQKALSLGKISIREIVRSFILFEYGSGSYYFAIMIEFIVLSPVILWIVKRFRFHGVVLISFLNLLYEMCCSSYGVSKDIYRILIFRYLFAIVLGMYVGLHRDKEIRNVYLIASFSVGLIYNILPYFYDYQYRIFTGATSAETSMFAVMYVFSIIYLILYYGYSHLSTSRVGSLLELIGRASYHIMCTQMIHFSVRPYLYQYIFDIPKLGNIVILLFDTAVSLLTGIVFYYVDNRFLTGRLIKRVMQSCRIRN